MLDAYGGPSDSPDGFDSFYVEATWFHAHPRVWVWCTRDRLKHPVQWGLCI